MVSTASSDRIATTVTRNEPRRETARPRRLAGLVCMPVFIASRSFMRWLVSPTLPPFAVMHKASTAHVCLPRPPRWAALVYCCGTSMMNWVLSVMVGSSASPKLAVIRRAVGQGHSREGGNSADGGWYVGSL